MAATEGKDRADGHPRLCCFCWNFCYQAVVSVRFWRCQSKRDREDLRAWKLEQICENLNLSLPFANLFFYSTIQGYECFTLQPLQRCFIKCFLSFLQVCSQTNKIHDISQKVNSTVQKYFSCTLLNRWPQLWKITAIFTNFRLQCVFCFPCLLTWK